MNNSYRYILWCAFFVGLLGSIYMGIRYLGEIEGREYITVKNDYTPTVRVVVDRWPGYMPALIAMKLGYCKDEKILCDVKISDDTADTLNGVVHDRYDVTSGLSTAYFDAANDDPDANYRIILATDQSLGSDGIIARKEAPLLSKNPHPLFASGLLYRFLIGEVERNYGRDITAVKFATTTIPEEDALEMLRNGKADYHATYEPYITRAKEQGMRVEYTSAQDPGIVTDVLVSSKGALAHKHRYVEAFTRAYFRAQEYMIKNPIAAAELVEKEYETTAPSILEQLKSIKLLTRDDNVRILQLAPGYSSLPNVLRAASLTRGKHGDPVIRDPESIIDRTFTANDLNR